MQAKDGAGPTTNKLFRQALNAAIDRKRWADAVLLGYGTPKTLPLAQPNPGYDPTRDQAATSTWTKPSRCSSNPASALRRSR